MRAAAKKWQPKHEAIKAVFVRDGINPETGRKCKLHRCQSCHELFPRGSMRADHIEPVVDPAIGFTTWDDYIERMFVEVDGYQAICDGCHKAKTSVERKQRDHAKRAAAGNVAVRARARKSPVKKARKKRRQIE